MIWHHQMFSSFQESSKSLAKSSIQIGSHEAGHLPLDRRSNTLSIKYVWPPGRRFVSVWLCSYRLRGKLCAESACIVASAMGNGYSDCACAPCSQPCCWFYTGNSKGLKLWKLQLVMLFVHFSCLHPLFTLLSPANIPQSFHLGFAWGTRCGHGLCFSAREAYGNRNLCML